MSKLLNNLSFLVIFIGAIWAEAQLFSTSEGIPLQLTLISIVINGLIGLYLAQENSVDPDLEDYMHMLKIVVPALFTTHLFITNDILGEYWNFAPLALTIVLAFSQFLVEDEGSRMNYVKTIMIAHCAAQIFCSAGEKCIIAEAILLLGAYWLYQTGECRANIYPSAQYNYLTGGFCMLVGNCPLK